MQKAAAGKIDLSSILESTSREDPTGKDIQVHVNLKRTHPAEVRAAYAPANDDEGLHGNRAGLGKVLLLKLCNNLL